MASRTNRSAVSPNPKGINAAGQTIAAGGFDPILSVYDAATGNRIGYNDDGGCALVGENAGRCYDTYLELDDVAAGNYIVAVSMFSNFGPENIRTGNFENDNGPSFGSRTANWAFDIRNVEAASCEGAGCDAPTSVPLPATLGLVLLGAGLLGLARRRA